MSQDIFANINPSATSGNQLATLLNGFKDAVASGFSGTARPPNLQAGGYWVDTTLAPSPNFLWSIKVYTGTVDITVFSIDLQNNLVGIAGTAGSFDITKTSADAVGAVLELIKKRIANNGQTLVNDVLGEVNFKTCDNLGSEIISARIKSVSLNNTTSAQAGAYIVIEAIDENSGALLEKLRIIDGKFGFGEINPQAKVHVKSATGIYNENESDTTVGAIITQKKRRVSGGGQVLANDVLAVYKTNSTDSAGVDLDSTFSVEAIAVENHTTTAQGTRVDVKVKKVGVNTATTKMQIGDVLNFPDGHQSRDEVIGTSGTAANNVKLRRSGAATVQVVTGDDSTVEGSASTSLAKLGYIPESFTDTGKPAAGNLGRIIWISDLIKLQYDNGTTWVDIGSLANPMTTGGDIIYGGSGGTATRLPNGSSGQYLKSQGTTLSPIWTSFNAPTIQRFTSGSGTYTAPTNVKYIKVTLAGGGGGGQGRTGSGGTGGNTAFGTSLLVANGGVGGTSSAGSGGTTPTINSPALALISLAGGSGGETVQVTNASGGSGGTNAFGGGGQGGVGGGGTGIAGIPNTGAGGGGAGGSGGASFSGGGSGAYVVAMIDNPSATYSYSVGAGGSAGATAGSVGGSGVIIVEEFYQ